MAFGGHELLLIVRAQNQASQALRRVAMDAQRLGSIRDLHLRQGQLAINQSQLLSQRQARLNALNDIESTQGARSLSMQRRKISNRASELGAINRLEKAQAAYNRAAQMGISGPALIQAGRTVEMRQKQLSAIRTGTQQLGASEIQLANRARILRQEIETTNMRLAQNAERMKDIGKAIRVQRWDRVQTGARIMTHLGRVMQMAGLVSGAALGFMAHTAAQWNTEVTLAATQTGKLGTTAVTVAKNSRFLQTALLGVMKQSTASRQEITAAAYDIYSSLNVSLKGGIRLMHLFAKASIAGMTPLNDVTKAGVSVMNAFNIPVSKMPKTLNRMFAAVRFGRMSFKEFTGTLSMIVPAFSAAGQSFDQMVGAMAFMSRVMPNLRMGATGLARMMEVLGNPKFTDGLKKFNVTITDAHGKLKPLDQIIQILIRRFPKLAQGGTFLQNFFKMISGQTGFIQARRAFTNLVLHTSLYRNLLNKTSGDQNEFSRSLTAMSQTGAVRWQIFLNNLKAFSIQLGEAVLPALIKLTKPLQNLAHWFEQLSSSQKDSIGRYALYAAAILLFGGTVISVGGMILSFIAVMGKFGIAGSGIAVIIFGIVAAIKVLQGDWSSMSDAVSSGVNSMLGSFKGFVIGSALLVAAALKIRKAFVGIAAMQLGSVIMGMGVAGAGAGGARGALAGLSGAFATGRLTAMYRAEAGAGRLAAGLAGAGAAAAALPGPLKIAAAAIGLGAAAAGLWKLHMSGVEAHAARIARFQHVVQAIGAAPGIQAARVGQLGGDVREVVRQRNAVADLNAQIRQTRKDISAANAADKPGLHRQLVDLILQRADATDTLRQANARANQSFGAMQGFIQKQVDLTTNVGTRGKAVIRMQRELNRLLAQQKDFRDPTAITRGLPKIAALRSEIKLYQGSIVDLANASAANMNKIRASFTRTAVGLRRIDLLPKLKPGAIDAMLRVALRRGRMLTIPEMRLVARAFINPASLRKMPHDIQAAVRGAIITVRVTAHKAQAAREFKTFSKSVLGRVIPAVQILTKPNIRKAQGDKAKVAGVFKKTIHQKIHIDTPQPDAFTIGAAIIQGITAGVQANSPSLSSAVSSAVIAAVVAGKKAAHATSPSKRTRDEIGIPLAEGIVVGILSKMPDIERSSRLAVDFFNGPWLTSDKFNQSKKKVHVTMRDIIKDLRMQLAQFRLFNRSLETLARRGVPLLLLDQLSQLGVEGAAKIAKLANATRGQLNRYVSIWRKAMREIQRSVRSNFDQIVGDMHNFMEQAAQNLLDKWNEIHDGITGSWFDLTRVLDNMPQPDTTSLEDLRKQLQDVYQQLNDITKQEHDKISDEFGKLFEGAYIASQYIQTKLQWGQVLNMQDLMKDLQSQVDAFRNWRNDLKKLAGLIPSDMLKELMDLGPQAAGMIHTLANASASELAAYVALWRQKAGDINAAVGDMLPDKDEFKQQIADLVTQISDLMAQIVAATHPKTAVIKPEDLLTDIFNQGVAMDQLFNLIEALRKKHVPEELLQQLANLGPDALPMLNALNNMTQQQLNTYLGIWSNMQEAMDQETTKFLKGQIAKWKQHGADIAAGIIAGIMSEQQELLKFFRKLFLKLLREARKETKSHSPSLLFAMLGEDIVEGLALGLGKGNKLKVPIPGLAMGGAGRSAQQSTPTQVHMTVHAHQDESLMTTLERASFRLRNRRP